MNRKQLLSISLAGDVFIAVIAYFLSRSSYSFSVSRYVDISLLTSLLLIIWPLLCFLFFTLKAKFNINKYSLTWIFCITLSFFVGIILFAGFFSNGESIRINLFSDEMDSFMDFFNSIQYGMTPYQHRTIYPPFISVVYGLIGQLVHLDGGTVSVRASQMGRMIFLLYSSMLIVFLVLTTYFLKKGAPLPKILFVFLIFFTRPFLFALDRGNSVIIALLFIMLFLKWYTSTNILFRMCSYVALGVATGIKIAPFILILLILRRREYLNTVIATGITALVFLVPFIFTDGNLWILAKNLSFTSSLFQGFTYLPNGKLEMIGYGVYVNFVNLMNFLGRFFNFNAAFIGKYLNSTLLFIGCFIVLAKRNMEEWKAVTILIGLIILFPGFSAIYNLIYMIPPLILYIDYYEEKHKAADGYLLLFVLMMIPFLKTHLLFYEDVYGIRIATLWEMVSVNAMVIILILFSCHDFLKRLHHGKLLEFSSVVLCFIGYTLYYTMQPSSVDAFYPMNFMGAKAQQGVVMSKGFYKYIDQRALFTLNREKVVKTGLTVTILNENNEANEYEIYVDNALIKQGMIEKQDKALVYLEGKILKTDNTANSNTLKVEVKNKGKQQLTLQYVGNTIPLEKVANKEYFNTNPLEQLDKNMYLDDYSVGFFRNNDAIQMGTHSRFLFSGNSLKNGILFKYAVPSELLISNFGKDIVLDIIVNKNKIKTIPITSSGEHYTLIEQFPVLYFDGANEVEFKLNAFYTNKQYEYDENEESRGIFIRYFGNLNKQLSGDTKPFTLTPSEKREWFYPANAVNGKDVCIIYEKNRNFNRNLQIQVEVDGRKEIRNVENSKFNEIAADIIHSEELGLSRKISALNLKLLNGDENDKVSINYVGPSVLNRDLKADQFTVEYTDKDKNYNWALEGLKRTKGLHYDPDTKSLRMVNKAEILLDNYYMKDKNLELVFRIPEGLSKYFDEKDKNVKVYLDNEAIRSVLLREGVQKVIINKTHWNRDKRVSVLAIKSTLYDLSKRKHMTVGLRERGLEILYIGTER